MDRRTLMGLLDDVDSAGRDCETAVQDFLIATKGRTNLARADRAADCSPKTYRKDGRHECDVHAALDLLRASIDRLQGLVAELPHLDLPARPEVAK